MSEEMEALVGPAMASSSTGTNNMVSGFSRMCRACASCTDLLVPIFHGEGLLNNLPEKIQKHLPIKVSEWDRLPQQLCRPCADTLLAWHELVKCCSQADAALRTRLQRLQELHPQNHLPTTSDAAIETVDDKNNVKCIESRVKRKERSGSIESSRSTHSETDPSLESGTRPVFAERLRANFDIKCESEWSVASLDDATRLDSDVDEDDKPLQEIASETNKLVHFNKLYKALVNFQNHYDEYHRGSDSTTDTDAEIASNVATESPERHYDDLTPNNRRRDCFDEETRRLVSGARAAAAAEGGGGGGYRCGRCGRRLRTAHTFVHHLRIHSGEKPCVCHVCGKRFRVSAGLQRHVRDTHERRRPHACRLCGRAFANRQNLAQHARIHTGERPFVCATCGRSFAQSGSLHAHARTHAPALAPHACATCGARFRQRSSLRQHGYKHTGERPHACPAPACGKAYRSRHQLNVHALAHTGAHPHACPAPACARAFRQRRALRNHCRRAHDLPPSHPHSHPHKDVPLVT